MVVLLGVVAAGGSLSRPAFASPREATAPVVISSEAERRLFAKIACMCPTCPRIPLSTCQCGFAGNERDAIRKKLRAGWSEERVLQWYLKERGPELGREVFAQAALTVPPDTAANRLSWLLPYALSAVAAIGLVLVGLRWSRRARARARPPAGAGAEAPPQPPSVAAASPESPTEEQRAYEKLLDLELKKLD
jgi:cytochrome c-type biogenesis protein CcmH/NrfF